MKVTSLLLAAALVPVTALSVASGRVGVYAIVESVSFEPAQGPPQRIRIQGVFAYAEQYCTDCGYNTDRSRALTYSMPMKGYMYFQLPELSAAVISLLRFVLRQ